MSLAENEMPVTDSELLHILFSQLDGEQVETFYKHYQQWQLKQQCILLEEQRAALEQQIVDNQVLMQLTQPSPIALATLTHLQSLGVDDVDLLDSMLERGDTWLDHTLQLLEQCERLDVIHGNYTVWCQHALEDAYNWLDSIHEIAEPEIGQTVQTAQAQASNDATEDLLLQKLMSEDETIKVSTVKPLSGSVGTASSRPSGITIIDAGRDEAVPTEVQQHIPIPSVLSYAMMVEKNSLGRAQRQEEQQKSLKCGLVSRILASVWQK